MRRFELPPRSLHRTALALALLAAFGPACGQEDKSEGSIAVGLGALSGNRADRALFGQYNGLRNDDFAGLLGFDYSRFVAESGTTLRLQGANLGLDTRELNLLLRAPGDWKLRVDYGELVRRDPYTIRTGLTGAGTALPQVNPIAAGTGAGSDLDLKIKRTDLGLAFTKELGSSLQYDVSLKSGRREGARLFGIGMNCPSPVAPGCLGTTGTSVGWATLMLPEPIDAQHTQVEARLAYGGEKLRLNGGYYASFYRNAHTTLNAAVPGGLNNAVGTLLPLSAGLQSILNQPLALPPDNEAHQFDVAGIYAFTPTTRLSFKLAQAQAKLDQNFAASGVTGGPTGFAESGGEITTTTAHLGLTARPLPKLSLLANLQYRKRDDETPVATYNVEGGASYSNRQLPNTRVGAKLQGGYQFAPAYRGTLAVNYETIDRGVFTSTAAIAGTSALRQKTEETGVRAELRRRMAEDISAAVSIESSRRDGSNWLKDNSGVGVTEIVNPDDPAAGFATAIFMPTLADRRRDKAKLHADWQPTEELSLQLGAEGGRDRYEAPSQYGVRSTRMSFYSFDVDYALTDTWRVNGNLSYGRQRLHQSRPDEAILSFDNRTTGAGIGLTGRVLGKLDLGGEVSYIEDRSVYAQALDATAGAGSVALLAATGGLPDIVFRQTRISLFGRYELDKRSQLRLNLVYQRSQWNDWTWGYNDVPFVYTDGSTVMQKPVQEAAFIGVSYVYRWQ